MTLHLCFQPASFTPHPTPLHMESEGVCSDWGECKGCFCWDGSGNNWPSIDDFYSAKISACWTTSLPRMRKSYVQKRNLVRHRKQHKLDDGPCFPCSQCDKKFTMSDDLHSHMNHVHLKIKPFNNKTITKTIYFIHPSGKLKLSFDRTMKNISQ